MAEPCKYGNKPLAYTKREKFIHKLSLAPGIRIMGMLIKKKTSRTSCPRNQMPTTLNKCPVPFDYFSCKLCWPAHVLVTASNLVIFFI
jgi:hypothetical protein